MSDHAELLRRFQPQLKYDSNEAFFADSAAEWTDNPGNVLRRTMSDGRPGPIIAATMPGQGQGQLSLGFFGEREYGDHQPVEPDDVISTLRRDYREMYVALRQRPGYANRMYGRAVEDSSGRLWLQYWFFYFYNDYNLAGGIGLHEGDWELVQLRLSIEGEVPDLAVYAQHRQAEKAPWDEVEKLEGSADAPVVYVARGSHASYFSSGRHETEAWFDIADGRRKTPKLALEIVGDDVPGWLRWRGRWGDTRPRFRGIEQPSPLGPCVRDHWDDPKALLEDVRTHERPASLPPPEARVERRSGRLVVVFDFSKRAGPAPERLVITVNSVDDKLPPRTFTFAVEPALRGTIETRVSLAERQHYDIYVSTTDAEGRPSASHLMMIDPAASGLKGIAQRLRRTAGRLRGR